MINEERLLDYLIIYAKTRPDNHITIISATKAKAVELQNKVLEFLPNALTYAIGIGGEVWSYRTHLVVMFNCFTVDNQHDYDKHLRWYLREVRPHLDMKSEVIMIESKAEETL
jgi:hypothetical protein